MSNIKHTPGPWEAGHYSSVVGLPVMAQPDKTKNTIIMCGVRGERAEAEANARLIAAAPELLEAVEKLIATFPMSYNRSAHDAIRFGRAAIAKATGVALKARASSESSR